MTEQITPGIIQIERFSLNRHGPFFEKVSILPTAGWFGLRGGHLKPSYRLVPHIAPGVYLTDLDGSQISLLEMIGLPLNIQHRFPLQNIKTFFVSMKVR